MDGHRFDDLARAFAGPRSRRRLLGGLVAGLGGALGLGAAGGRAAPRGGGKPQGRCATGYTNCRGTCVILAADENHCGACSTACPTGWDCCGGTCRPPESFVDDVANCGGCGVACPPGQGCCGGECRNDEGAGCATAAGCCGGGGGLQCLPSPFEGVLVCHDPATCVPQNFPCGGPDWVCCAGTYCDGSTGDCEFCAGEGGSCEFDSDACCTAETGRTCTTDNGGHRQCCASGKACVSFGGSVCCQNPDASCYTVGCCETGKSCGLPGRFLCCGADETCNEVTGECAPL